MTASRRSATQLAARERAAVNRIARAAERELFIKQRMERKEFMNKPNEPMVQMALRRSPVSVWALGAM